jgi:hypothetical protein
MSKKSSSTEKTSVRVIPFSVADRGKFPVMLPRLALAVFLLLGNAFAQPGTSPTSSTTNTILEREPTLQDGIYATFGVGVIDVEPGSGVNLPLGFTLLASRMRTLLTVSVLDMGLLQRKSNTLSQYRRIFDVQTGGDFCFDSETQQFTNYNKCSGDTDVLRSMTVDVNFLPVTELYVADHLGVIHVGLGVRALKPRTVYGTLGMFFPSASGKAIGAQLSMGRQYIYFGMKWGLDVRRIAKLIGRTFRPSPATAGLQ